MHIRNEEIRNATTVQPIPTHLMHISWYGIAQRRDDSHTTRTLSYTDTIGIYIKTNGLTDVTILDRKDWRIALSMVTH